MRRAAAKRRLPRIRDARNKGARARYHASLEKHRRYFRDKARDKRLSDPSYTKRRYAANREKYLAQAKAWAKAHPGAYKRRYHANVERYRARARQDGAVRRALKKGSRVTPVNLARIMERDKMTCHLCRKRVGQKDLHFDHVIPLSRGGEHAEHNLAVSHKKCNLTKHARVLTLF